MMETKHTLEEKTIHWQKKIKELRNGITGTENEVKALVNRKKNQNNRQEESSRALETKMKLKQWKKKNEHR